MSRRIERAQLVAVGSELTTGETRDTHGGDLAREITALGVTVGRIVALPDRLDVVADEIARAAAAADLVVTTGGLGPTPDDLTREAIAAVIGALPYEDEALMATLRDHFERRGAVMAASNRKQAWLVDGATSLPNPHGSAPGWWVERADGAAIVALPGPPRELHPMWREHVMPRLRERGLGADRAVRTLRLFGIGESALVDRIGEERLRRPNPEVATYAREDAVDVRVSAAAAEGRSAAELVRETVAELEATLSDHVFGYDHDRWTDALARRLGDRTLAAVEIGTGGALAGLLGAAEFLRLLEVVAPGSSLDGGRDEGVEPHAEQVRMRAGTDLGLALRARERAGDTAVSIAIASDAGTHRVTRTAFLGGEQGRRRAAIAAAAELWVRLADG
jgi:nicotinamide-nucleotide amidase